MMCEEGEGVLMDVRPVVHQWSRVIILETPRPRELFIRARRIFDLRHK